MGQPNTNRVFTRRIRTGLIGVLVGVLVSACSDPAVTPTEDAGPGTGGMEDAQAAVDVGFADDADTTPDADPVDANPIDGGHVDAEVPDTLDAGQLDAMTPDADAPDADLGCIGAGRLVGQRYPIGDNCNFCTCEADGSETCTNRQCGHNTSSCMYDGAQYPYAVPFMANDGCNECVCAASGLACTRRCPGLENISAILLESLTDPCGDDMMFTPNAVLMGLPTAELDAPFLYERNRRTYPETLPNTRVNIRVVYDGGFAVCRIPSPTQPAIDMEVLIEWTTDDGAFDETFHTYLRRNNFGFVDAWTTVASSPAMGLDGTYDAACFDHRGTGMSARFNADGTAEGRISKICESDIALDVGTFNYAP